VITNVALEEFSITAGDGLRERVEAIDGAAAFIRHCGAYGEHLGEPAPS